MDNLQNKTYKERKSMLIELVQKGFKLLKTALVKFKIQAEEIDYITDQADHIFSRYMENGLYDKIDSICEDDLFDKIVEYSLNSAEYNIDEYVNFLLDERKYTNKDDRQVVIAFFHEIRDIIIKAQNKYGIKDSEHQVISKQIQAIQETLNNGKVEQKPNCLIGVLACENDDPRTRELLELPENSLLDLTEHINKLEDFKGIKSIIEQFKSKLNNSTTYKVKLACNYSIAYLAGAIFSQKTSNLIFINRDNEWSIGRADKIKLSYKVVQKNDSDNMNVAITIGITSYIDDDVREFIGKTQNLVSIHYDCHIQTSGQFNAIGNEVTKKLKKIAREYGGPINLFYRGPVEIMFLLGQKSNDFGQCTIYEFNFKERDIKKQTYTKGITF